MVKFFNFNVGANLMGILSSSVSITRYNVKNKLTEPVMENIYNGLRKNTIEDIDKDSADKTIGWTSFENPYVPDFEGSSFVCGSYFIFSLRIDKKSVPVKLINKFLSLETEKRLKETDRKFLSRNEKKIIKDEVIDLLYRRIPAAPNIYDIIWNYEQNSIWFFSNLKAANEELETLFSKSFNLTLIRLFPYTDAYFIKDLSDTEKDLLTNLSPTKFSE